MRGDIQMSLVSADSVEGLVKAKEIRPLVHFAEKSDYPGVPRSRTWDILNSPKDSEGIGSSWGLRDCQRNIQDTLIFAFQEEFQ